MKRLLRFDVILFVLLISGSLVGCDKEYYENSDIQFSVVTPDTIYLDSAITIKGTINQPLDIRIYIRDFNENSLIGILKSYSDSISWTPTNLEEGYTVFCLQVNYKRKRNHGAAIGGFQGVFVKKKPEADQP